MSIMLHWEIKLWTNYVYRIIFYWSNFHLMNITFFMGTILWQCCSAKLPKSPCCVSYFSSVSFISYFFPAHNSVYNFTKTQVSGPEPLCHCCIGDWVTEAARDDICSNYLFLWVEAQLVIIDPVIMPESSPGNKHNSIENVLSTPQTKRRKHSTFSLQSWLTLSESIEKFAEFLLDLVVWSRIVFYVSVGILCRPVHLSLYSCRYTSSNTTPPQPLLSDQNKIQSFLLFFSITKRGEDFQNTNYVIQLELAGPTTMMRSGQSWENWRWYHSADNPVLDIFQFDNQIIF